MADGSFPNLVSRDRVSNSQTNSLWVRLTDDTNDVELGGGVEAAALRVTMANDSTGLLSIDDNGGSLTIDNSTLSVVGGGVEATALRVTIANDSTGLLSIDDNGGSITVDGSVTVTATNLDIRDLVYTQDSILIYANTAKDGSGTDYVPLVDADGKLILSNPGGTEYTDDSAFTVGVSSLGASGFLADEAAPDSVDEGDIGLARMTLDRKQLTVLVDATTDSQRLAIDATGNAQVDLAAVSVTAVPVSKDGNSNSETNPIYVYQVKTIVSGTEVHDYDTASAVASDASDNHDYTVTGTTFFLKSVIVAGSGNIKFEVQVGPVLTLVTKAVGFLTGRGGDTKQVFFDPPIEVPVTSTGTVRVIRTNRQGAATDLYSTIIGNDV